MTGGVSFGVVGRSGVLLIERRITPNLLIDAVDEV
jgi:hypothetical protein